MCILRHGKDCLKSKEEKWLSALTEAIRIRDNNLNVLQNDLKAKIELINERDKEISHLKDNILEITKSLNIERVKTEHEKSNYEEELIREKQKMYTEMQMAIDEEKTLSVMKLEDLKTHHAFTIMELARGMKRELEELELQLENEKAQSMEKMTEYNKIQNDLIKKTKQLDTSNTKLKKNQEEMISLKNKCDQSVCEKKKLIDKLKLVMGRNEKLTKENLELNDKIKLTSKDLSDKLEFMITTLNTNQEKEVLLLDTLQKISDEKLSKESDQLDKKNNFNCVSVQTDNFESKHISDLMSQLSIVKSREEMLEDHLKCYENEMKDFKKQNEMLKEVIRDMKRDREQKIRQIEQEEDESRVKRLEESVKALKATSLHNHTNDNIWIALGKFKEELNLLKGRDWHRFTKHNLALDDDRKIEENLFLGVKELIKKPALQETRPNKSILKKNKV